MLVVLLSAVLIAAPAVLLLSVLLWCTGATVFPVVDWLVHTGHTWSQAGLEVVQAPPDMWTAQVRHRHTPAAAAAAVDRGSCSTAHSVR